MNNELIGFLLVFLACLIGQNLSAQEQLSKIAFGSCAKQDKPQPIWDSINARSPQLFLFLGDNIYGDTQDMDLLRKKWE